MMAIPSDAEVGKIIREVAAAEIMPRFRNLSADDVRCKSSPQDLVTAADIATEQVLTRALSALLPGCHVVGEEAADANPQVLDWLAEPAPVWIIDPVDGTNNFANGRECFAVLLALCVDGATVAGWIYDPVTQRMVRARQGQGAWVEDEHGSAQPLRIAAGDDITVMRGSLPYRAAKVLRRQLAEGTAGLPCKIGRLGSTGREYADLACGTLDFAEYLRLKPWDHAAGVLIHQEAGGCGLIRQSATPYHLWPMLTERTLLLAPSRAAWRRLDAMLG